MTERDIQDRIELMCRGCVFSERGACSNALIWKKGQRVLAGGGLCDQALVHAIDQDKLPEMATYLISVIRFRTPVGRWDTQVDPLCT